MNPAHATMVKNIVDEMVKRAMDECNHDVRGLNPGTVCGCAYLRFLIERGMQAQFEVGDATDEDHAS